MAPIDRKFIERALASPVTRRKFLQGLLVSGALASMPGGLLKAVTSEAGITYEGNYQVFRNACPP